MLAVLSNSWYIWILDCLVKSCLSQMWFTPIISKERLLLVPAVEAKRLLVVPRNLLLLRLSYFLVAHQVLLLSCAQLAWHLSSSWGSLGSIILSLVKVAFCSAFLTTLSSRLTCLLLHTNCYLLLQICGCSRIRLCSTIIKEHFSRVLNGLVLRRNKLWIIEDCINLIKILLVQLSVNFQLGHSIWCGSHGFISLCKWLGMLRFDCTFWCCNCSARYAWLFWIALIQINIVFIDIKWFICSFYRNLRILRYLPHIARRCSLFLICARSFISLHMGIKCFKLHLDFIVICCCHLTLLHILNSHLIKYYNRLL